ncbi:phosphoenolpyruvate--protein phosphotransferase [Chiayiivirga flava]|uniref:Phosphoenolpyruvate-protein phosphotransferase n=1 Tax=Chiayiivirga flava TaxID=659595 RepID=A0A7W8FZR5_9GAMM|nr:phosphoenolpyruvate--protein phosphotransferase [Chiayiivirga flava]MBB5208401.1 phosphotransferase system enzyme I (PtsI) [Chiayiivirga flava]
MRLEFTGAVASRGLAIGRARVREPHALDLGEQSIAADAVDSEIDRLHRALESTRAELGRMREQLQGALAQELGEFLDLHALILDDPELIGGLDKLIRTARYSAGYALKLQRDRIAAVFDAMDDPYMRSRREDLDHVIGRVYAALHRDGGGEIDAAHGLAGEVLVCDTVAPAELAQLVESGCVAVVAAQGSPLSHSAILARSLHLPLVVGAHQALQHVNDGDTLLVDASSGRVVVEPGPADLKDFARLRRGEQREQRALQRLRSAPSRTVDGVEINLHANAESREDVAEAFRLGAAGVGLYRTEFLFLQRRELPTEDEQFAAYRDLVLGMNGRPVTLRTLDLGADKADASGVSLAREPNPALGLRGVRLSLARPALFRTQMRAMLRASGYGFVRILVPMVTCREEMLQVRALAVDCARDLRTEGFEIADHLDIGAMIEVPAAALALPTMIDTMDFVSIGTNDLVQYLLAADRGNDAVADIASPLHPAVLRVLHDVIATGRRCGKPVAVCGELAGDIRYTRVLLALGLTDFSMHPGTMLEVRNAVRGCEHAALRKRSAALLRARDRDAILAVLARLD